MKTRLVWYHMLIELRIKRIEAKLSLIDDMENKLNGISQ